MQQTELDLPQADDIKINDMGLVMRAAGNGIELVPMNFSFAPSRPRGGPVFNFRSEGRLSTKAIGASSPQARIFRIHWQETSEGQASLRAERIADHSDCGHLARGQRRSAAGVYDAGRRAPPGGLGGVDLPDQSRNQRYCALFQWARWLSKPFGRQVTDRLRGPMFDCYGRNRIQFDRGGSRSFGTRCGQFIPTVRAKLPQTKTQTKRKF